jgi:hypothetical protein
MNLKILPPRSSTYWSGFEPSPQNAEHDHDGLKVLGFLAVLLIAGAAANAIAMYDAVVRLAE